MANGEKGLDKKQIQGLKDEVESLTGTNENYTDVSGLVRSGKAPVSGVRVEVNPDIKVEGAKIEGISFNNQQGDGSTNLKGDNNKVETSISNPLLSSSPTEALDLTATSAKSDQKSEPESAKKTASDPAAGKEGEGKDKVKDDEAKKDSPEKKEKEQRDPRDQKIAELEKKVKKLEDYIKNNQEKNQEKGEELKLDFYDYSEKYAKVKNLFGFKKAAEALQDESKNTKQQIADHILSKMKEFQEKNPNATAEEIAQKNLEYVTEVISMMTGEVAAALDGKESASKDADGKEREHGSVLRKFNSLMDKHGKKIKRALLVVGVVSVGVATGGLILGAAAPVSLGLSAGTAIGGIAGGIKGAITGGVFSRHGAEKSAIKGLKEYFENDEEIKKIFSELSPDDKETYLKLSQKIIEFTNQAANFDHKYNVNVTRKTAVVGGAIGALAGGLAGSVQTTITGEDTFIHHDAETQTVPGEPLRIPTHTIQPGELTGQVIQNTLNEMNLGDQYNFVLPDGSTNMDLIHQYVPDWQAGTHSFAGADSLSDPGIRSILESIASENAGFKTEIIKEAWTQRIPGESTTTWAGNVPFVMGSWLAGVGLGGSAARQMAESNRGKLHHSERASKGSGGSAEPTPTDGEQQSGNLPSDVINNVASEGSEKGATPLASQSETLIPNPGLGQENVTRSGQEDQQTEVIANQIGSSLTQRFNSNERQNLLDIMRQDRENEPLMAAIAGNPVTGYNISLTDTGRGRLSEMIRQGVTDFTNEDNLRRLFGTERNEALSNTKTAQPTVSEISSPPPAQSAILVENITPSASAATENESSVESRVNRVNQILTDMFNNNKEEFYAISDPMSYPSGNSPTEVINPGAADEVVGLSEIGRQLFIQYISTPAFATNGVEGFIDYLRENQNTNEQ